MPQQTQIGELRKQFLEGVAVWRNSLFLFPHLDNRAEVGPTVGGNKYPLPFFKFPFGGVLDFSSFFQNPYCLFQALFSMGITSGRD